MRKLGDYDSESFGPIFAVSDEGSAARLIREAAYSSAKARAFSAIEPLSLGVILDGERMTSAGEVPIGPDEYEVLNAVAIDRLPCTTNVGIRVNAKLLQPLPECALSGNAETDSAKVVEAFAPFLRTPDGVVRPLTILLTVNPAAAPDSLKQAAAKLEAARSAGKIGPHGLHKLAALVRFEKRIGAEEQARIKQVVEAASAAGIDEVMIDGELRQAARLRLSVQGLLNVLEIEDLRSLMTHAASLNVRLSYPHRLDVPSAARTVWTGLHAARTHGFAAGKYGLVPMTLEEQRQTIGLIQGWTRGWSAIPAFYVDTPLVTTTDVFDPARATEGAVTWLRMVHEAGVNLVLFDCPDRIGKARKLLRSDGSPNDPGVLTLADVDEILAEARALRVAILWSGGITERQAYELSKRRVHGLFSTSSTAHRVPVSPALADDPSLPAENEPTALGVRRVHALVQAGFLGSSLRSLDPARAEAISSRGDALLAATGDATLSALRELDAELLDAWSRWSKHEPLDEAVPVPPDAVRVFRGRRRGSVPSPEFLKALGTMFMPITVQMQRLYGLTAYLPAVLPVERPEGLPDEIALVFYRTQAAYDLAKQCIGGRSYSAMHDLVFDMQASKSGFPELLAGAVRFDVPYHLFPTAIDWQRGSVALYVGARQPKLDAEQFRRAIAEDAQAIQQSPGEVDGAILCCTETWLIVWAHVPRETPPNVPQFKTFTTQVWQGSARRVAIPPDLTTPFPGFEVSAAGDFLCMQFPRL